MTAILDRYINAPPFRTPRDPQEFLAMQMARKLSDIDKARDYIAIFENFPEQMVINAFRLAKRRGALHRESFLAAFRELTEHPNGQQAAGN
jgi:hypothetical protein